MKIVQFHDETWDSGLAHYALTLTGALRARGHEVSFWAKAGSHAAAAARAAGLETVEIERPWVALPSLRARMSGVAVLNAHTGSAHSLAAALAAGTNARVIRTRGDARPPSKNILARALAHRTDAFIAPNRGLRDALLESFPESRVELVFQGIAKAGQPAAPPDGPPVVGILGRLDEVKGHAVLLDAAAALGRDFASARFLAAGEDTSKRLDSLRRWTNPKSAGGFWARGTEVDTSTLSILRLGITPRQPKFFLATARWTIRISRFIASRRLRLR